MPNPGRTGGRNAGRAGRTGGRSSNTGRSGRGSSATPPSSAGSNRNNNTNSRGGSRGGSRSGGRSGSANERSGRGGRNGGRGGRGRGRGNNQKVDTSKMSPAEKYKYLESKMNQEMKNKREKAAKVIQIKARALMERIKFLKALEAFMSRRRDIASIRINSHIRGYLVKIKYIKRITEIKYNAAIKIQKNIRCFIQYKKYDYRYGKTAGLVMFNASLNWNIRDVIQEIRTSLLVERKQLKHKSAIKIQAIIRMFLSSFRVEERLEEIEMIGILREEAEKERDKTRQRIQNDFAKQRRKRQIIEDRKRMAKHSGALRYKSPWRHRHAKQIAKENASFMSKNSNNPAIRRLAHSSARAAATLNAPSPTRKNLESRLKKLYRARDEIIRGLKENGVNVWVSEHDHKVQIGGRPGANSSSSSSGMSRIDEYDEEIEHLASIANKKSSSSTSSSSAEKTWFDTKRINIELQEEQYKNNTSLFTDNNDGGGISDNTFWATKNSNTNTNTNNASSPGIETETDAEHLDDAIQNAMENVRLLLGDANTLLSKGPSAVMKDSYNSHENMQMSTLTGETPVWYESMNNKSPYDDDIENDNMNTINTTTTTYAKIINDTSSSNNNGHADHDPIYHPQYQYKKGINSNSSSATSGIITDDMSYGYGYQAAESTTSIPILSPPPPNRVSKALERREEEEEEEELNKIINKRNSLLIQGINNNNNNGDNTGSMNKYAKYSSIQNNLPSTYDNHDYADDYNLDDDKNDHNDPPPNTTTNTYNTYSTYNKTKVSRGYQTMTQSQLDKKRLMEKEKEEKVKERVKLDTRGPGWGAGPGKQPISLEGLMNSINNSSLDAPSSINSPSMSANSPNPKSSPTRSSPSLEHQKEVNNNNNNNNNNSGNVHSPVLSITKPGKVPFARTQALLNSRHVYGQMISDNINGNNNNNSSSSSSSSSSSGPSHFHSQPQSIGEALMVQSNAADTNNAGNVGAVDSVVDGVVDRQGQLGSQLDAQSSILSIDPNTNHANPSMNGMNTSPSQSHSPSAHLSLAWPSTLVDSEEVAELKSYVRNSRKETYQIQRTLKQTEREEELLELRRRRHEQRLLEERIKKQEFRKRLMKEKEEQQLALRLAAEAEAAHKRKEKLKFEKEKEIQKILRLRLSRQKVRERIKNPVKGIRYTSSNNSSNNSNKDNNGDKNMNSNNDSTNNTNTNSNSNSTGGEDNNNDSTNNTNSNSTGGEDNNNDNDMLRKSTSNGIILDHEQNNTNTINTNTTNTNTTNTNNNNNNNNNNVDDNGSEIHSVDTKEPQQNSVTSQDTTTSTITTNNNSNNSNNTIRVGSGKVVEKPTTTTTSAHNKSKPKPRGARGGAGVLRPTAPLKQKPSKEPSKGRYYYQTQPRAPFPGRPQVPTNIANSNKNKKSNINKGKGNNVKSKIEVEKTKTASARDKEEHKSNNQENVDNTTNDNSNVNESNESVDKDKKLGEYTLSAPEPQPCIPIISSTVKTEVEVPGTKKENEKDINSINLNHEQENIDANINTNVNTDKEEEVRPQETITRVQSQGEEVVVAGVPPKSTKSATTSPVQPVQPAGVPKKKSFIRSIFGS